MNTNLTDFKNDYYNLKTTEEICLKYNISRQTYFNILKELNLKRDRTSKLKRVFNISNINTNVNNLQNANVNTHIPIDKSYKVEKVIKECSTITLKEDDEILYDNRIIKQKLPKKPIINVIKQEEEIDTINTELYNKIMGSSKKTLEKIKNKK